MLQPCFVAKIAGSHLHLGLAGRCRICSSDTGILARHGNGAAGYSSLGENNDDSTLDSLTMRDPFLE